jgi:hypothetical protein
MLPLLDGDTGTPVRDSIVYHSASGKFALRRDGWVFIDAPSGDDNQEPEWFKAERGYTRHDHPGELFDLRHDISEKTNLYGERPEVVLALAQLLDQVRPARDRGSHARVSERQSE